MFDAPLDAWYVWLALGAVSLAVAGIVLASPTASPAATAPVADAVDRVAASEYGAYGEVGVPAGELRLGTRAIALRTDGGTAHARFEYGPVTPVRDGELRRVLAGTPPPEVFADPEAFREAVARARGREGSWREAPTTLRIRRVTWGEVDATLVG